MTKPKPKKPKEAAPELKLVELPPVPVVAPITTEAHPAPVLEQGTAFAPGVFEQHSRPAKPMGRMVSYFDPAAGVTRMEWREVNFY